MTTADVARIQRAAELERLARETAEQVARTTARFAAQIAALDRR